MAEVNPEMQSTEGIYRRLLGYLRPYPLQLIIAYGALAATTLFNLFVPQVIKGAIDQGLADANMRALLIAAGIILVIALLRSIASFAQLYYGEWLSHRVGYDLRNDFYQSVQGQSFTFHDKSHTGDLMSRATGDISETEHFTGIGLADLIATILLMIGVVTVMLWEEPKLTLIALIPVPFLIFTTIRFGNTIRPMFRRIQDQMGILSTRMQESLTGIRVVKSFAREPYELEKFDEENGEWFTRRFRVIRAWSDNWPVFNFLITLSIILLLFFGGPLAIDGVITVGTLFAMITYVLMLNGPVQRLGFLVNQVATAGASASRVFAIMDEANDIQEPEDPYVADQIQGDVRFEDVSFAYLSKIPILDDITFHAEPGRRIALIGPTGSGKSTVTNLIPRFYNVDNGRVLVDNIDVRDWQLRSLRSHIGIVLQDPFLFSQSIAENISYGCPEATDEEIIAAAKAARAHNFILEMAEGYDTRVGERGVTLSGGQKQRIAIARALLTNPRILILDDSTSSVDTETEHLIQQALDELMVGRTTFVIAQRLLTLKQADCILVLDKGQIIERGTHEELLKLNGLYRQIYDMQLRDQEEFVALQASLDNSAQGASGS
ncbi:MAG: ABC transporter ATP-binding protein [Candidatus Promineifilaceae bacterium]